MQRKASGELLSSFARGRRRLGAADRGRGSGGSERREREDAASSAGGAERGRSAAYGPRGGITDIDEGACGCPTGSVSSISRGETTHAYAQARCCSGEIKPYATSSVSSASAPGLFKFALATEKGLIT
eukprot:3476879-Rhodomonas_salina.2